MASSFDRSGESVGVNDISRISAGSVIKGEITSPNDIRIDGSFEGKIVSQAKVVVGEKAVIKGDIVCIIEAMKMMTEIKSDLDGVISEVLVENEDLVEFDQPLFKVTEG